VPLWLGLASGVARWRESGPQLVALLALTAIWLWTAGQTGGGYVYSLRVLTPALALGAALGAALLGRWAVARSGWILVGLLTVLAIDAGARSLHLPLDPSVAWWRKRAPAWRVMDKRDALWSNSPNWAANNSNWAAIIDAADGRQIVVSDPDIHAILAARGAKPVPLFSPALRFLFEPNANYPACLARLRAQHTRFIIMVRISDINDRQLALHPFFQSLQSARPVMATSMYFVYDLNSPELGGTIPIGAPPVSVHAP